MLRHIIEKTLVFDIIQAVIRFQILERTETAGGPEGPPLIFIGDINMSKPYLTYTQQIQKLKDEKGLIINDEVYAEQVLTDIGYFSLIGGYKNLFINPMTRKYEEPTTIEDIISSIQLGATVDYAILFTDRYRE